MLVMKRNQEPTISDFVNQIFNNDFVNRMEESFNVLRPKANIKENEKSYVIEMMVPGFSKKDFAIEVENETLKISANVDKKEKDSNEQYIHEEFSKMSIERNFTLSNNIDTKNISASYSNGILNITVPKKEETIIKKMIEIK
jgi:HSP20 family protein